MLLQGIPKEDVSRDPELVKRFPDHCSARFREFTITGGQPVVKAWNARDSTSQQQPLAGERNTAIATALISGSFANQYPACIGVKVMR